MNMTNTMRNWYLALVSIALLAVAGASSAAKPAPTQKQFYAKVESFVSGGTNVPVELFVHNTATEPATINTLVVCNTPNVTFVAPLVLTGPVTGNVVSYSGLCTGVLIKDISGLRRDAEATFALKANVSGTCSAANTDTVRVYASTGNTTSFTADFFATDENGNPPQPPNPSDPYAALSSVYAGCDGIVGCSSTNNVIDPTLTNPTAAAPNEPLYAKSIRGPQNSNGTACVLVPYDFQNRISSTGTDGDILLRWPEDGDQRRATFFTSYNTRLRDAPTDGTYPLLKRPKVAWAFTPAGAPDLITDALTCLENDFPRQYAVLQIALAPGVTSATAYRPTTGIPEGGWKAFPTGPFPLNIGDERVMATASGTGPWTLTLQREQGGTTTAGITYPAEKPLISTPFPLGTQEPYIDRPVRICIAHHGFQIYTPDPDTGLPRYYEAIDYYDGDGWIGTEDQ